MPVRELMTWIPGQKRWTKMYMGRRYYVSARQLRCPETKEGSLAAANSWWRDKQAELDYAYRASQRNPNPMEDATAAVLGIKPEDFFPQLLAFWEKALSREAASGEGAAQDVKAEARLAAEEDAKQLVEKVVRRLVECVLENKPLPDGIAEHLPPARAAQVVRGLKEIRGEEGGKVDDFSVKTLAEDWHSGRLLKAKHGKLSVSRVSTTQSLLGYFTAYLGEAALVSTINEESLRGFYHFCLSRIADKHEEEGGWSTHHAKEVFGIARTWVRWLVEQGKIAAPRNLESKEFDFRAQSGAIQTWTVDEVRHVIGAAKGKLKLALLLMVNCGMYSGDVSDLLNCEVEWRSGRITRKRSKTKDKKNAPTISYPLWPITFALLKEHRSGTGPQERVLLTKSGLPFVRKEVIDDKCKRADSVRSLYLPLARKLGFTKQMKLLRKTSASRLESHEVYGRFTSAFLGHVPGTIKDRHYANVPQPLFDEAVLWLGRQFGFVEAK